jgi:acyl-CoA synthetase (AMP-forming)/AMP-acid ligase II
MEGLIQFQPLLLSGILEHAARNYPDAPIVSVNGTGLFRYTYAAAAQRARRLASSLQRRGFTAGDFVGSLGWTTHRHLELLYAAPGIGIGLHTANPRLSTEQLAYTINHAGVKMLFVDPDCVELVETLAPRLTHVRSYVVMGDRAEAPAPRLPEVEWFEDLVAAGSADFVWPSFDESRGSTLCFTSGTTGNPKGILYTQRGCYLSTLALAAPNAWSVSDRDAIVCIAPLFHCNGWGAPFLGPMTGAKLVLPGRALDGRGLLDLIVSEGVTVGPAVPTVWQAVLDHARVAGGLGSLNRIICGGAAPPLAMMRAYWQEFAVRTVQVWGMTETTHAATLMWTSASVLSGQAEPQAPQGNPVFGMQIRTIDDEGRSLPRDGQSIGHLQVRGHSCATGYLKRPDVRVLDAEGWLETGDLAAIGADGALRITDRLKDVIKSGGEWISSIDLENAASSHSSVAEAAVVGVPHPRWQERPVMFVVLKHGRTLDAAELRTHLSTLVAKWWLPDDVVFVDELPHNSTGKVMKNDLRTQYGAASPTRL